MPGNHKPGLIFLNLNCLLVDGSFGEWGEFGECSMNCGPGVKTRTRSCSSPKPQHGGRNCIGKVVENAPCQVKECGMCIINCF